MKNKISVHATAGIDYILTHLPYQKFDSILDLGCGDCKATHFFRSKNKTVTALGLHIEDYGVSVQALKDDGVQVIEADFFTHDFAGQKFNAIWAAHILEHTANPGLFVDKIRNLLTEDGYAIITVPPYKSRLVGGHLNTGWTLGQLAYFLLLQGFDIKNGQFIKCGYNLSAIVKKSQQALPALHHDKGDLEKLSNFFPPDLNIAQNIEGDVYAINWPHPINHKERRYRLNALKGDIITGIKKISNKLMRLWK